MRLAFGKGDIAYVARQRHCSLMPRPSVFAFAALALLTGCNNAGTSCAFLDKGFVWPSPVDPGDLPSFTTRDDTAIALARRNVEYCYNKRPSLRAEEIVPFEARRGRSGQIYLLYLSRATTDTVVGFTSDAKGYPLFAVEGASPSDFYNRSL